MSSTMSPQDEHGQVYSSCLYTALFLFYYVQPYAVKTLTNKMWT